MKERKAKDRKSKSHGLEYVRGGEETRIRPNSSVSSRIKQARTATQHTRLPEINSNATDRNFIDAHSRVEASQTHHLRRARELRGGRCEREKEGGGGRISRYIGRISVRHRDTDEVGPGLMLQLEAEKIERPSLKRDDSKIGGELKS